MTRNQTGLGSVITAALLIAFASPASGEAASSECLAKATTQTAINICVAEDLRAADAELNALYQRLLTLYADKPEFLEKLRIAQRAWVAFRDADLEARFPARDKQVNYGTVYPMCAGEIRAGLTRSRLAQLKEWDTGMPEGGICGGSIRIKD